MTRCSLRTQDQQEIRAFPEGGRRLRSTRHEPCREVAMGWQVVAFIASIPCRIHQVVDLRAYARAEYQRAS
jgi:hypothetical protein